MLETLEVDNGESAVSAGGSSTMGGVSKVKGELHIDTYRTMKEIVVPSTIRNTFVSKCRAAVHADTRDGEPFPTVTANDIVAYMFVRVRAIGTVKSYILRSPRGHNDCSVNVGTNEDGDDDYAVIKGIFVIHDNVYVLMRFYNRTHRVVTRQPARNQFLEKQYTRLLLTKQYTVVNIQQVQFAVYTMPSFEISNLYFVNDIPMGTTLVSRRVEQAEEEREATHQSTTLGLELW
jgi:hypothetical protein